MTNTTLKKISEILGISVSTVSRALKHHPDISVKTREKVIELARTLDYEPNANAVQLRTKNSKLLGLMVPTISNYFYETFIAAVEEDARKNGYAVMILQSGNDPLIESENLKLFRQNRVSGVFVCLSSNTKDLSSFEKMFDLEIPVVFFDNVPQESGVHKICLADEKSAQLAAELILQHPYQSILAIFGNPALSITKKREAALKNAFQAHPHISLLIEHANSSEEAKLVCHEMLNKHLPDIIFCMSDEVLIGVLKTIQEKGLRYPDNIALLTISNGTIPRLFHPQITYIETSGEKLGKAAFAHMLNCMQTKIEPTELLVDAVLFNGGSL
ncbi:MAG: LacI family DNA-binding transcriptional regulator [Sediminibacterium sp. Gen4]|uniref:LacI family DNA-binding transcriptional regulator n=1 Tax=unclassified Sediminibacterium TaxID=2635961 RepID=UPI0015B91285|nr:MULTISPECIES: LacI family DNA-binding transcriptional regulator [unclassified Sediminibacterium]MBW0162139.1 LacI family transcriptional regulator [Sediminibacterium sp.]MBW0163371.1 LacI family transcriptional regulator [Sediminibacterium sp.]NWK66829.1 LacI family DNA-binding transcriptional regulator [Sediminibacterium sp. Gen4]